MIQSAGILPNVSSLLHTMTPERAPVNRIEYLGAEGSPCHITDALQEGRLCLLQVGHVMGIVADARNDEALDTITAIKREETPSEGFRRPFSTFQTSSHIHPMVDTEKLFDPIMEGIFNDPDLPASYFGGICHLRIPLIPHSDEFLPESLISHATDGAPMFQYIDPTGNSGLERFVEEANERGLPLAVTTVNKHSEPEIPRIHSAIEFLQSLPTDLSKHISDTAYFDQPHPNNVVQGSFAIGDFHSGQWVRDGFIPVDVLNRISPVPLGTEEMKPAAFPQLDFSSLLESETSGPELRTAVLDFIYAR